MNEISDRQKNLLKEFEDPRGSPILTIHHLWRFLKEKPKDEPLSPRWPDVFQKYRRRTLGLIPSDRQRLPLFKEVHEIMKTISIMDDEIWDIRIDENTKITLLLGAGASVPSGIPAVDKLLSELWKRARKIGREDLDRLAEWCNERRITNIEDLLTAAYISNFVAKKNSIASLLNYFVFSGGRGLPEEEEEEEEEEEHLIRGHRPVRISEIDVSSISFIQDTLQTLFSLLTSTMISAIPNRANEAIVDFIREHKNTSIITTNYDGCMDEAILKAGMRLKGTIASGSKAGNDSDAVELIKMHGSINWSYCDSCQDVREFDLLELKEIYEEDKLSYPVMGICKNCGGLRRPLLVPPLSFKFLMFPNLIDIWSSARQSIERADYLIVVGYSFSEADTYITKVISRSMFLNKNQEMIIVSTNLNLVSGLRERFSAHIDGFDKKRILKACDNCEEILPRILKSVLGKSSKEQKGKSDS